MSIGIIAAVSPDGIIGVDGTIPWHYPEDFKRFKRLTIGATVIMGRLTWESLPKKPLVDRRNIVITSRALDGFAGVDCFSDIQSALESTERDADVWFIGGARIYQEAMKVADFIDLTFVPDRVEAKNAVKFPDIDLEVWEAGPREVDPLDSRLERCVYRRRRTDRKE